MNIYSAAKRLDGRWGYTLTNGNNTYPIGYCAGWNLRYEDDTFWMLTNADQRIKFDQNKDRFHTDAHPTKEEAIECYKHYRLDMHLSFHIAPDIKRKCSICGEWTSEYAQIGGYHQFFLCDLHVHREFVSMVYMVGESLES